MSRYELYTLNALILAVLLLLEIFLSEILELLINVCRCVEILKNIFFFNKDLATLILCGCISFYSGVVSPDIPKRLSI